MSNLDELKSLVNSQRRAHKEEKLLNLLRKEKARRGLQDLFFFAKYILHYDLISEQPHRDLCNFLMSDHKKKLILEPRGSFKSTIGNASYAIWKILRNPNIRILIDSEDLANSKKFLTEIKNQIEHNEEFIDLYGNLVGNRWTDSEIIVSTRTKHFREPTIHTAGVETTRVGLHFDLIICDDLHSKDNTQTPEQINKVIEHWKLNAAILEPQGEEIVIGTRWKIGDLYEEIINLEKERRKKKLSKSFIVRRKAAVYEDGSLHFPTRLTKEFLEDQRIILGSEFYACQYLNNPVDEGATYFKKSWIRWYGRYAPINLRRYAIVDPAISERDEACYSAFVVIGVDEDGLWYVLDAYFLKDSPDKIVDMMFKIQEIHNPHLFGIETVVFQKALKYWVWERMRQRGKTINIIELNPDTRVTKDMRIKGLIPWVESGTLHFPGDGPERLHGGLLMLYDQLTQYPMTKFIDGVDALTYFTHIVSPATLLKKPKEVSTGITFQEARTKERSMRLSKTKLNRLPIIGRRNIYNGPTPSMLERVP